MIRVNLVKPKTFIQISSTRSRTWIEGVKWLHLIVKGWASDYREAKAIVYTSRW